MGQGCCYCREPDDDKCEHAKAWSGEVSDVSTVIAEQGTLPDLDDDLSASSYFSLQFTPDEDVLNTCLDQNCEVTLQRVISDTANKYQMMSPSHSMCRTPSRERSARVLSLTSSLVPSGLDDWLQSWCTEHVVGIYLRSSQGVEPQAAKKIAAALRWRQQNRDLLTGERIPNWQGDMRVAARSDDGHPIVMMSMRHQPARLNNNDCIDHTVVVLESAVKAIRGTADSFDIVCDCREFDFFKNMDPRPAVAMAEILKNGFRGRFRRGWVVAAPKAFSYLWAIASKAMPEKTQEKIKFVTLEEAVSLIEGFSGQNAANVIDECLAVPTAPLGTCPWTLPSELSD